VSLGPSSRGASGVNNANEAVVGGVVVEFAVREGIVLESECMGFMSNQVSGSSRVGMQRGDASRQCSSQVVVGQAVGCWMGDNALMVVVFL
jgi:hypothetical protein